MTLTKKHRREITIEEFGRALEYEEQALVELHQHTREDDQYAQGLLAKQYVKVEEMRRVYAALLERCGGNQTMLVYAVRDGAPPPLTRYQIATAVAGYVDFARRKKGGYDKRLFHALGGPYASAALFDFVAGGVGAEEETAADAQRLDRRIFSAAVNAGLVKDDELGFETVHVLLHFLGFAERLRGHGVLDDGKARLERFRRDTASEEARVH